MSLPEQAVAFLALHRPGHPVVLPTVWDAWSAGLAQEAGFLGLTVGSHPVAVSLGTGDHEGMTFTELLTRVAQITDASTLPVSVDIESGYGLSAKELVAGLLEVNAVGCNIEDTVHSQGGRLRSAVEHAELVGALRAEADTAGVHLVINARTDLFIRQDGDAADRQQRAVDRLNLAAAAGADVLYPVGGHDAATWAAMAAALPLPINAISFPERESLAAYAGLGVGRISFGPRLQNALADAAAGMFKAWL